VKIPRIRPQDDLEVFTCARFMMLWPTDIEIITQIDRKLFGSTKLYFLLKPR